MSFTSHHPNPTVRSLSSDNVTGRLQLGRSAPTWVPDTASPACQGCQRKFSFLVRRHHCRCCGRLLCSSCSNYFAPLSYLDWQVVRVCQGCDQQLNNPAPASHRFPAGHPGHPGEHRRSSSLSSLTTQEERIAKLVRELQIQYFNQHHQVNREVNSMAANNRDINALPQEILSKIMSELDYSDQRVCRYVSQNWAQAINTSNFYNHTIVQLFSLSQESLKMLLEDTYLDSEFKHYRFRECTITLNTCFWRLMAPGIRTLELVSCEVTEKELCLILLMTTNLESLTLEDCRDLFISGNLFSNEEERNKIQENLNELKYLNLNNNKYLCDVLLLNITRATPNLVGLSLAGCNIMNDAGVYKKFYPDTQDIQASPSVLTWRTVVLVVTNLVNTLTDLNVSFNTGVDLQILSTVAGLNLSCLNVAGCGSVTLPGLQALLTACPNITSLDLSMCRRVFTGLPETVHDLFLAMSTVDLQELKLNLLSIASFKSVALIKNLKRLELNTIDVPGSEILKGLEDLDVSRLEHLSLRALGAPSADLAHLIQNKEFPSLKYLDLSCGGETVNNKVIQQISRQMPNLENLCLHNNLGISDAGVLGLSVNDNTVNSLMQMKEWLNRNKKIFLGSRQEHELHLAKLQVDNAKEILEQSGGFQDKPGGFQDQPGGLQDQPGRLQDHPGRLQDQPGGHPDQAGRLQDQPGGHPDQAGRLQDHPGRLQDQPGGHPDQAGRLQDQPGGHLDQAGRLQDQPGGHLDQAGRLQDHPGGHLDQAGRLQDQPGGHLDQAGRLQNQPGRLQNQPGRLQDQPGSLQNQPYWQQTVQKVNDEPLRMDTGLHLLRKLKELDLSQTCISGLSLKLGITSPDLRKLNIENCAEISDSALYDFAIRHPRLQELRIGSTSVSDTSLISCLSCLPRLVNLNVASCKNLSNAGVRAISQIAPQLEVLVLSNCQNISMETARILETSMTNLTVVTLGLQAERYQQRNRISAQPPPSAPVPPPPPFNPFALFNM